ncbi:MAG TPA: exo-alpha-sialidase [Bacteroidales bacterium]|nr:exo-alpha-sialidase [Bacteroidales bacterium]
MLHKTISIFIFFCILTTIGFSQNQEISNAITISGSNFRIYSSNVNQTEVFIKRSPLNPELIFSSCNTLSFIPFFISEGIYVSSNGGQTWIGNDTCTGEPISFHGGDPGIVIDKNGRFILTRLGRSPFVGLYSHYSLDNGQTWSTQQVISTDDLERATLTSDAIGESSFYGRTYAAWVKFAQPFPLMFSFTDDGAQSWSTPVAINNPASRSAGGDLAVGPDGELYACWAGVTDVSPFKEILVGFARSANGGETWNVTENAFPMNGITGVLENKDNIRVNGLPSIATDTTDGIYRGRIYIVTGEKGMLPAGSDPDIVLHFSDDGGNNWSNGIRVNQDDLNNGKTQYFPSIHIDKYGAVNVLFYDDRKTTSDSTGVFLARSKDGGETWNEYEVSDHNFKPTPIGGLGQGYQGDNIDISSTNEALLPVWMDNSTGLYQIWSTRINFTELNAITESSIETEIFSTVYPNPFAKTATIEFTIDQKGDVIFELYDQQGSLQLNKRIQVQLVGKFQLDFDDEMTGKKLNSGLYYYRLLQNGKSGSGKLIIMQ